LILSHLRLLRQAVGKLLAHLPAVADVENLEAAGILGLVEAAGKFRPELGIRFGTYAYPRVRGAVLDELRRNHSLPQNVFVRLARLRKACETLSCGSTVEALSRAAGLSPAEVLDSLAAMRLLSMSSLEGRGTSREVTDRRQDRPDRRAEQAEQNRLVVETLAALPERERRAVTLYYLEDLRLRQVGDVLGLSESRVSRLLHGALFRMAEFIRERETRRPGLAARAPVAPGHGASPVCPCGAARGAV
jgi:RNA polymerase sigma factor for flagellar operon FliA